MHISSRSITAAILIPLAAVVIYFAVNAHMSLTSVRAANAAAGKFPGRHAVVVGGTSGIGYGIALRLAQADFTVTIVGRNAAQGEAIVKEMTALGGSEHSFVACDSQLLGNAIKFSDEYAKTHDKLDVLVLTQGIATTQGRTETAEGLDQKLALHYYSRVAFIDALLPLLRKAPSPRVLTVLSAGVHNPYHRHATDPELKNYSLGDAANAAGFYNDLAMDALSRVPENNNIVFAHAAPGFVNTNWGKELGPILRTFVRMVQPLGRSPRDCGEFMSTVLLQKRAPGFVLIGQNGQPVKATAKHEAARDIMWAHTQEVLGRVKKTLVASGAIAGGDASAGASGASAGTGTTAGGVAGAGAGAGAGASEAPGVSV